MPASLVDGSSILVLDIGHANTHALLFDVVEGHYRFIAIAEAASTAAPPANDVIPGIYAAIQRLEEKTGQHFLDENDNLIIPSTAEGYGVDSVAATISAGPALKIAVAGLLADVSVESAQRLGRMLYGSLVETLHINDTRSASEQINALAAAKADVIVIAGGTDGGATRSLEKMFEIIGLGAYLASEENVPTVVYAGNQALAEQVRDVFENVAEEVHVVPNLRPSLEIENLAPAASALAKIYPKRLAHYVGGVETVQNWAQGNVLAANYAQLRIIRLLGGIYSSPKGVMHIDLGAESLSMMAAYGEAWQAQTLPMGSGQSSVSVLQRGMLDDVMQWLALDLKPERVRDYIYSKYFYPHQIPANKESLAIEQAMARVILQQGVQAFCEEIPAVALQPHPRLLPLVEPIFVHGEALLNAGSLGATLLTLLDGLQPVGVTTLVLDENNLLSALGVIAEVNPLVPAQVLETGAFTNLATVISPISNARKGAQILSIDMVDEKGNRTHTDVKQGGLEIMALPPGSRAKVTIAPKRHTNAGFGPGRGREITISGSLLGLVIDGRGRPLSLPDDAIRRRESFKKWLWVLGG